MIYGKKFLNKTFYFVSEIKNIKSLTPRIPINYLTKNGYEDKTTKRICVCTNINNCLIAMSKNLKDKILYVYEINSKNYYKPTIEQVPDVNITDEYWILEKVDLKLVKKIKINEAKIENSKYYNLGKEKIELFNWDYEVLEEY